MYLWLYMIKQILKYTVFSSSVVFVENKREVIQRKKSYNNRGITRRLFTRRAADVVITKDVTTFLMTCTFLQL